MVGADGHVYLSDFGLAKEALATSGPTTSEQWVGTLDYVAPEQIRGRARRRARRRVRARRRPLLHAHRARPVRAADRRGEAVGAPARSAAACRPRARPGLPPALDAVVARAMAKDPARATRPPATWARARAATGDGPRGARSPRRRGPERVARRAVARRRLARDCRATRRRGRSRAGTTAAASSRRRRGARPTSPSPVSARGARRLLAPRVAVARRGARVLARRSAAATAKAAPRAPPRRRRRGRPRHPSRPRVGATIRDVGVRPRAVARRGRRRLGAEHPRGADHPARPRHGHAGAASSRSSAAAPRASPVTTTWCGSPSARPARSSASTRAAAS